MVDRLTYDLLPNAYLLTMPILMAVGDCDDSTPPDHQQLLFDALPWDKKKFHLIDNATHTFDKKENLDELYKIFDRWIKNI